MRNKIIIMGLLTWLGINSAKSQSFILKATDYKKYVEQFNHDDDEVYKEYYPNDSAWAFMEHNIPLFDCPDNDVMLTYYFRWWTLRKHIRKTPTGFIFTEFLPSVYWAGKYNSIACSAALHIYEARWLRDPSYIQSYTHFWFTEGDPRMYSFWAADALWQYYKVKEDPTILKYLPDLVKNYKNWEKGWERSGHFIGLNDDGLFSTYDDRDGMEMQIGGSGKRPTINSYMFADAVAISQMAEKLKKTKIAETYLAKAEKIRSLVEQKLWDEKDTFFKTLPNKANAKLVNVRELQGYTPWYVNLPTNGKGYESAWQFIKSSDGFDAPYGLTTAEQKDSKFRISYQGHECQWNGPSWPFATSQTLTALANVLNNYQQNVVTVNDYFAQFLKYTHAQRRVTEDGKILPWIDEDLNPYTGDWISRTRLKTWENGTWPKGCRERGKDYNHSTYCDLLISGLVGIRPQTDNKVVVHPLIPEKAWDWFCLDGISYHGHTLTVLYDRTGNHYKQGQGLTVFVDGTVKSNAPSLQEISLSL